MSAPPIVLPLQPGPPLAALAATLPDGRRPLLLESGGADSPFARWDVLAFDPDEVLELETGDDPEPDFTRRALGRVEALLDRHFPGRARGEARDSAGADADALPPFRGGVLTLLGYDLGRQLERLPARVPRDASVPDLLAQVQRFVLAERRADGRRLVVGRGTRAEADDFARRVGQLARDVRAPDASPARCGRVASSFDRDGYVDAVRAARERILDGDVYQVNLSQRFAIDGGPTPDVLAAALRSRHPVPFAALLRAPSFALVSNSPELFLRRRGERLLSRPIKGTRPRGRDAADDARLRAELEASPKETAELAMIVDLVRNDLGRSAVIGSVQVDLPFETDVWPTVFHRVAGVRARVAPDASSARIVEAAFPPASVTGTPKISALALIESLEPVRRHAYTGALGWFDADGDLDLSVLIRIATRVAGRWLVPVGGGITLQSDPAAEYEETLHKARGMFAALGLPAPSDVVASGRFGAHA
ncbi:MAG: anthranilate synthase component I family protein [Planctomycetes bacterium]|nr:anthranilate synthase component I family protein [Planctomycetota bacterium]